MDEGVELNQVLMAGSRQLGLVLDKQTQCRLCQYIGLLHRWNKVYNLTAIRDKEAMVGLHLLDSLAVFPYLQGENLLDVGTGAGFPGVPLALLMPDLQVTVLDSNIKKTSFIQQVKQELNIDNLTVVCKRVEQAALCGNFDMVVSRAFASLEDFMRLTRELCRDGGIWLMMKGLFPHQELARLHGVSIQVFPVFVPQIRAQRNLIVARAI